MRLLAIVLPLAYISMCFTGSVSIWTGSFVFFWLTIALLSIFVGIIATVFIAEGTDLNVA